MSEIVRVSTSHAGEWIRLTFQNVRGNILTREVAAALRASLASVASQPAVKLVTLEGGGSDFSFGASIEEHAPGEIDRALPETHALVFDLIDLPVPTAALVRGRCLGGGFELALGCDLIFAAEDAVFGLPEISLGVFPPAACALLAARVGQARATRAILTGQSRPAPEWQQAGLIEFVATAQALQSKVERWFETQLQPHSARALRHAVSAVRFNLREHARHTLPALERYYLDELMQTHDAVEGVQAFIEKRRPVWTNG